MATEQSGQLHNKYRPKSLDEVIGNEKAVTSLKGIIKSGKWPSAIAFFGQPSAGKTTLSQCLAADALGIPNLKTSDYTYVNMSDSRGIDDVRQLVQNARLAPSGGKRRFIHLDEVQGILSSPAAAACLGPETLVLTSIGRISAKELHARLSSGEDIQAVSFNHVTKEIELKKFVSSVARDNSKPMVKVNGANLTDDHRIHTEESGYKAASGTNNLTGLGI
jgi:adenylate kinase family enzyme